VTIKASDLHVISVISNPIRYKSRRTLFQEAMERNKKSPATHWYIEATFGERDFEVTDADHPNHIQVRCDHELWIKENLINYAVSKLPADWKYVMWMDGDIAFYNENYIMETLQALQHYKIVQPWSHAIDLGPNGEVNNTFQGFAYGYCKGVKLGDKYGQYMHPGFCWAWRREAWDQVGGMIDLAILGSGDDHMAKALIGEADRSLPKGLHPNYVHMVKQWEDRALRNIKHDIGYVPGMIIHHFHGKKSDRNYWGRWDILKKHQYDPYADVTKDSRGMLQLSADKKGLRDGIRTYFRQRNEDTVV
jgi:hypothetical protein